MIKLIASDLDGTLLPKGEKRVSADVERVIKSALNKGVKVAIITGRSYPSLNVPMPIESDGIYCYCCGGAVGIKGGKTLYSKPVNAENVILALKTAKSQGISVMLSSDSEIYFYGENERVYSELCEEHGGAVKISCMTQVKRPVYKISFFKENGAPVFTHAPTGMRLWYRRNGLEEYINCFAGKDGAISDIMMREGVLAGETAAAGDELESDLPMLKKAGRRFATTAVLAREADAIYITDPCEIFSI